MVEIKLEHISKKYVGAKGYSVTDFNLKIKDKEFIVFVGPSGCGKSTTLRMIAGLEGITQGGLYIDEKKVNDEAPKDRDIAMVFQNYALYPHMTVFDNMAFGLKLRKYSEVEIEKRVQNAAQILGLADFLKRKPAALSGGQRQRVTLGRAIVRDAPIFLMDEPLSNLDAKLRVSMRAEIAKLHRSLKTTTIYVTHDQTEAMTMADRIVVMRDGEIQQVGTPREVYEKPVNVFVADFIGAPATNFFDVTLQDGYVKTEARTFNLAVPEGINKVLKQAGYEGKKLILGVRPEHIHTERAFIETFPSATVKAKVVVSELLGSESILYTKVGDSEFVSKVDARDYLDPDQIVELGFDLNRSHFFDPETKESIL
ncbi:ABC transporter ATP-binding protein [Liquorilactobacillus satsumensis]|uniref:ABC transporter ATP-binding protein n=1 Tax=Liquorilactobacillus satsumensis TaxID=259059 RepID=UPI001E4A94B8|nr:sn-glycerol-3-phosphate ABC transporter ATP-binding protein UgpC [Liquorilactobacillus satsumensis]MCC7667158.1 sugar ABC transporter ATP-binding protein [Liquorilactobacillus satsumensis]MCP9357751.1 sn-glycerol-3-phosphate ABC transporter ATP-binding protein UgpC [Liquorilactobacillus satsumensis]MCP9371483.1 sn-glycerol-3-phosphate ABC transporter ATP-binding protein UgpC [Liquorilactobacillus satsumensis]